MEGKIDKFKGKCNKQLKAVGSIKRKLTKTKSLSTSTDIVAGYDDPDLDHLLENTDQDIEHSLAAVKQKQKTKGHKSVTVESSNIEDTDENLNHNQKRNEDASLSSNNSPNKYQIPSSMIVLTRQEEAELRDVIMQMTLRDCGL